MKFNTTGWHENSEFLSVHGVEHHLVRAGEPTDKPPVVFIHGLLCSSWAWRDNIDIIAAEREVLAPCLKGFGWSQRPPSKYDIADLAGSLLRLLDALEVERFIPVGNSLGGSIALYLAYRYPDRIADVVLVNPLAQLGTLPSIPRPLLDRRLNPLYRIALIPTVSRIGLQLLAYRGIMVDAHYLSGFTPPLRRIGSVSHALKIGRNLQRDIGMLEPTLSQLKQRILIIWGTGDKLLGARGGLKLQAAIPDARLIELERCGHCAHEEYPERFNAILSAFIGH